MKKRTSLYLAGMLAAMLLAPAAALAEHFEIDLSITEKQGKTSASADTYPPPQGRKPRPVCHCRKDEPLVLQFFVSSNFPHDTLKGVIVRYFIVAEKNAGQAEIPGDRGDAVLEGSFLLDFNPQGRVGMRQQFRAPKPGVYLVRVESDKSANDHEHFSAIDLIVE